MLPAAQPRPAAARGPWLSLEGKMHSDLKKALPHDSYTVRCSRISGAQPALQTSLRYFGPDCPRAWPNCHESGGFCPGSGELGASCMGRDGPGSCRPSVRVLSSRPERVSAQRRDPGPRNAALGLRPWVPDIALTRNSGMTRAHKAKEPPEGGSFVRRVWDAIRT